MAGRQETNDRRGRKASLTISGWLNLTRDAPSKNKLGREIKGISSHSVCILLIYIYTSGNTIICSTKRENQEMFSFLVFFLDFSMVPPADSTKNEPKIHRFVGSSK